ncbi:MAG: hypothetical protein WBB64_03805 [Anaerolineales bacterium]
MTRQKKHKGIRAAGMVALLGIFCAAFMSCKSPSSPDEESNAEVYIVNVCGAAVDVYINEVFKTTLENDSDTTIEIVTEGIYLLEASKTGTDISVSVGEVEIFLGDVYTWNIWGPSTITITNNYGENLQIHVNGILLGDLDNSYSEQISEVTFGEHSLEAKKSTTGEVAASITFQVNDVADYFWNITKED